MEKEVAKGDLIKLWKVLDFFSNRPQPIKFSYFVAKNKMIIKDEVQILQQLVTPSQSFIEYDTKRVELAEKYADRDEDGKPIVENNTYIITEKKEVFDKELAELKEEYKEAIQEFEKQLDEYAELIVSDGDIKLFRKTWGQTPR